jgi:hypothetical protein
MASGFIFFDLACGFGGELGFGGCKGLAAGEV